MKIWRILLFLGLALPCFSSELNLGLVKEAIRKVENTQIIRIGNRGEYGVYQLTFAVWRQHSTKPHDWARRSDAICAQETDRVVSEHLSWIKSRLMRLKQPETAYSIALVWNAGYGNVRRGSVEWLSRDYARRVQNVYASFQHE